jgi:hypothetical protein
MGWFGPKKVLVQFVDADSGEMFARSEIPLPDLPASFAPATTVQLQGSDWTVVSAEPPESAEFGKTGQLTLRLRKVQLVDPRTILFSLPTICDVIPGVVPAPPSQPDDVLRMSDDDWRQIEFVALSLESQVDDNLAAIRRIHEQERVGVGFRKCHVRKDPKEPLAGVRLELGELTSRLGNDARTYAGVSFQRESHLIQGGYAFETGSLLQIYGQVSGGTLTSFCLLSHQGAQRDGAALLELARSRELCLVDWCRALKVMPEEEPFQRYFNPGP